MKYCHLSDSSAFTFSPFYNGTMADSSSSHHAIYRRQVCQYLSSVTIDPVLKEMETSMGRHALQQDKPLPSRGPNNEDAPLDMRVPPSLIHCHGCGACLQGNIRIQSINRGKTRRRRASRRMVALKRDQQRQSKSQQPRIENGEEAVVDEKELARLFQVTDGTSKNAIVQTCGHCDTQRKMKGLPAKKAQTRKRKVATAMPKKNDMNGDFVAMPKSTAKKPPQAPQFLSPLLARKKERKKKPEPKSGLMNFLSSLNN